MRRPSGHEGTPPETWWWAPASAHIRWVTSCHVTLLLAWRFGPLAIVSVVEFHEPTPVATMTRDADGSVGKAWVDLLGLTLAWGMPKSPFSNRKALMLYIYISVCVRVIFFAR